MDDPTHEELGAMRDRWLTALTTTQIIRRWAEKPNDPATKQEVRDWLDLSTPTEGQPS